MLFPPVEKKFFTLLLSHCTFLLELLVLPLHVLVDIFVWSKRYKNSHIYYNNVPETIYGVQHAV